jgi:hypothetical protein
MPSLAELFNELANSCNVPANIFGLNKPMRLLLLTHEVEWDGPRTVLHIDMGEGTMGRIFVPKPLTEAFTVEDFWTTNSGTRIYDISVVLHPFYQTNNMFHLTRVL